MHTIELERNIVTGAMTAYFDGQVGKTCSDSAVPALVEPFLSALIPPSGEKPHFDQVSLVNGSSGTFSTTSHGVSGITSWGNLNISQAITTGGNIAYAVCSSSNSNMVPKTCAATTPNSQITIATNSYVQVIGTFTAVTSTNTPTFSNLSVQWFSGNRSSPMSSTVWDNRYWLSLTTATTDTANDGVLVLDSKGAFSLFDMHAGGFVQHRNNLYHTDSGSSGNVYLDNQGYNDNGVAINAFVQTKDYCGEGPETDDYYESVYTSADNFGNYDMDISFQSDRNATPYTLSSINQAEFASNTSIKIPFPLNENDQNFGKCISLTFSEPDLGSPWNWYGFTLYSHPRAVQ